MSSLRKKIIYSFVFSLFTFGFVYSLVGHWSGVMQMLAAGPLRFALWFVFKSVLSIVLLFISPDTGKPLEDVWRLYAYLFGTFVVTLFLVIVFDAVRSKFFPKSK